MAVVLAATGAFLYLRLGSELSSQITQNLRTRADDIATLVDASDSGLSEGVGSRLTEAGDGFAQVLDQNGSVVDATARLGEPLLSPDEIGRVMDETIVVERESIPGLDEPVRLLARTVSAQDQRLVVVVGASLENRSGALDKLRGQLLVGLPIALLVASAAGYLLAAAALRPVESMRRRAAAISARTVDQRLPLAPADDEIRRLGETLNEMLARLDTALLRERRFVSDASHELRTPLALMKTEIELALRRTRSVEELEAALRSAGDETDRLSQLAEDLLVIARSDQGELQLRPAAVSVDDLFATVAERFGRRARAAGRDIVTEPRSSLAVEGDSLRLEQALGNLVENALRYGEGPIGLYAVGRDGSIELHVTDRGGGFPDAFLPRAFERFSRADEARARGGSGLGLAIVEAIASAHGGSAHAANRPDGGADVWLALPRIAGSHAQLTIDS